MTDGPASRPRRVYYIPALLLLVLLATAPARSEVDLTVEPVMTKGPAAAPVTIVEFSDYQ